MRKRGAKIKSKPASPTLLKLFDRCAVPCHPVMPERLFLDLELRMWSLLDSLVSGRADDDDTNDLAMFGNLNTALAAMYDNARIATLALEWNTSVVDIRERAKRVGRVGVSGMEYQMLKNSLAIMGDYVKTRPHASLSAAWDKCHAMREKMQREGLTEINI